METPGPTWQDSRLHTAPLRVWDPVRGGLGRKVEAERAGEKGPDLFLHLQQGLRPQGPDGLGKW